jgi:hypothetical protein
MVAACLYDLGRRGRRAVNVRRLCSITTLAEWQTRQGGRQIFAITPQARTMVYDFLIIPVDGMSFGVWFRCRSVR